jgi:PAS domain S-box-containing protein
VPNLLRVLIIDDDLPRARQIVQTLEKAGYEPLWECVAEASDFRTALGNPWDLILCCDHLDRFDAHAALKLLQHQGVEVPLIVLAEQPGEGPAVEAMQAGASDYLLHSQRSALGARVQKVLHQQQVRLAQMRLWQALNEHRERMRLILDTAFDAFVGADASGLVTDWNQQATTMFGWSREEALGQEMAALIFPPRLRDRYREELVRYQNLGQTQMLHRRLEATGLRRDQTEFPMELTIWPLRLGPTLVFSAFIRDLSQLKRAEATERELAQQRDRLLWQLRLQIERMPLAYILFDRDCRICDWNPAAERIFGYPKEEVLGMGEPYEKLIAPEVLPTLAPLRERLKAGDMSVQWVCPNRTRDGRTILCEWHNTPLIEEDGSFGGLLSLVQDITEKRRLEEQLRQAQKLEAIGRLAGGIAHDFNNLLTVITGYSDLALQELPQEHPLTEIVGQIRQASLRAADLTRQLLAFSRRQVLQPVVVDLNTLIEELEKMLRRLIGEDIDLALHLQEGLWPVRVDPGQMEQVLLNLVVNARDAMPRGGKLTIETTNIVLDATAAASRPELPAGAYVVVAVTDTGLGMDAATQARIFEPFFTTKGPEEGTGLGLATVYGIVKQSGGHITVYSEVGRGSCFKVYLPREGQTPSPPVSTPAPATVAGTETILLVEDDDTVRALAQRVLAEQGYRVLPARDGQEALVVSQTHTGPLHLMVTDVVMPRMSGPELAQVLTADRPDLLVLYVSGYMDDAIVRHGLIEASAPFLPKPYTPSMLLARVRQVLSAPSAPPAAT